MILRTTNSYSTQRGSITELLHIPAKNIPTRTRLGSPISGIIAEIFLQHFEDIQGVSRLVDITAGSDFLGLCDHKSSYKHVSDFGRLRSYDRLKLRIEGKDY